MKLQQVVINILGNAVKYTRSGGTVTLSAREKAAQSGYAILEFKVKDTGIGISEEYMPRIFDAFSQENNKYGARQMGSGLGLAICRSIVVMMKGSIDVVSELNKGSLFTITVQLGVPADNAVMDVNTMKLKKNAFRVTKVRGLSASRIRVPGGHLPAKYLSLIQEIAEKYGNGTVHLTIRQGFEVPGIPYEDMPEVNKLLQPIIEGLEINQEDPGSGYSASGTRNIMNFGTPAIAKVHGASALSAS